MNQRKSKYKTKQIKEQIPFSLDLKSLEILCSFIISENENIKKSHLVQLRKLINQINVDASFNDQARIDRMTFIKRGLEAKLDLGYNDQYIILKHINGGLIGMPLFNMENIKELNNAEVRWVNEMVAQSLKTSYIENDFTDLYNLLGEFKASDQFNKPNFVKPIEEKVKELQNKFRSARVQDAKEEFFCLRDDIFEEKIKETYDAVTSPSNKLRTGMQGFNEMIGGGFERGRLYLFLALPSEGKSLTMLNIAVQLKKYNMDYVLKDKTKTPCIVFLTMENSMKETIERLFNVTSRPESLGDYSYEEVLNILRTEGKMFLSQDNSIDLVIKYVPSDSEDTNFLYTLYDELEEKGYECIAMIQDYLKRIKSSKDYVTELRLELGYICNEFKNFGAEKNIPVISASQLNRDAARHIDETRKKNGCDLVRLFGRSNIGESQNILENADAIIFLAPEYDKEGNKYLGMQLAKKRFRGSSRSHMYQPFMPGNDIRFIEDEGLATPVCKNTLNPNLERASNFMAGNLNNAFSGGSTPVVNIGDTALLKEDSESNFFEINFTEPLYQVIEKKPLEIIYKRIK